MSQPQYLWRQLTPGQREKMLAWRKECRYPWHSPPHRPNFGHLRFLISAACFEHQHLIGQTPERMDTFSKSLHALLARQANQTFAWCVLPNHYHALVEAPDIKQLLHELGQFHGRTSYSWNGEDNARGRKVFFRATERAIRSGMVTSSVGQTGHGAVRQYIWRIRESRKRNVYGATSRSSIMAMTGTGQKCRLDSTRTKVAA